MIISRIQVSLVADAPEPLDACTTPDAVASLLSSLIGQQDRESFVVVHMNARNRPVATEIISTGTINSSLVHPREVFKSAILQNAVAIIIGHNHPSGELLPSREDKITTQRLVDAGKILGIEVLDHVIVAPDGQFFSFVQEGIEPWRQ